MSGWVIVPIIVAAGVAAAATGDQDAWYGLGLPDAIYGVVGFGIATATFAALATGRHRGAYRMLRDLTAWMLAIFVLATGYSYRSDLLALGNRVAAEIAPQGLVSRVETQANGERSVRIRRRPDGHFIARTELNGTTLTMLVDTGASTVVLRPADAQKLKIDIDKLRYNVPVQTANGTTYAASIRLKRVAVGPIEFTEIEALIAKPGALKDSLLGMSFLNRLRSYEFSGDYLTLRI